MSSSDDYYINILNNFILYLYRYGNPLICIFGNIGNLLSMIIFLKKSWRKNVCVFYFTICIVLNLIYINSTILGTTFIIGYNINLQNSNVILCKLFYYVPYVTSILVTSVLICASIDRLLISSQNVDTRLYSSKRLAYFSISLCTIFWIMFNLHILMKVNLQQFGPSIFVCYYDMAQTYLDFVTYSSLVITILNDVCMVILTLFALKNVRRIRSIPRQQRQQIRSMSKKDFQLLRCLFLQDLVYILLSTLLSIYSLYSTITRDRLQTSLEQTIGNFFDRCSSWLYCIFYYSNFLIFIIESKAFRTELKQIIYKLFGKQFIITREDENKSKQIETNIPVVNNLT